MCCRSCWASGTGKPSHLPALTPPSDEDLASLREQAKQPDFTVRLYRAALNLGLLGPLPKR